MTRKGNQLHVCSISTLQWFSELINITRGSGEVKLSHAKILPKFAGIKTLLGAIITSGFASFTTSRWFHSLGCKCKPIHEYVNTRTASRSQSWSFKVFICIYTNYRPKPFLN